MPRSFLDQFKAARRVATPLIGVTDPDPAATIATITTAVNGVPVLAWDAIRSIRPVSAGGIEVGFLLTGESAVQPTRTLGYNLPVATFGENIRRLRRASRLKAKDLAARMGVSAPVVSSWENDRGGLPETPTLFRLANALGCSIEDLLAGVDGESERRRAAAEQHLREELDRLASEVAANAALTVEFDAFKAQLARLPLRMWRAMAAAADATPSDLAPTPNEQRCLDRYRRLS